MKIVTIILFVLLAACNNQATDALAWTTDAERDTVVETRAKQALDRVRELTVDDLVSEGVVRAAVRGAVKEHRSDYSPIRDASYDARRQVFEEWQCQIFDGYPASDGLFYGDACDTARYSEGLVEGNVWYENAGIPVVIAPIIAEMRTIIFDIGRTYLSNPNFLWDVYGKRKWVLVREYRSFGAEDRDEFRTVVAEALKGFKMFRDDREARDLFEQYLICENQDYSSRMEAQLVLRERVKDLDLYLFAGRRYAEGGAELVEVYIEILTDLQTSLETVPPIGTDIN